MKFTADDLKFLKFVGILVDEPTALDADRLELAKRIAKHQAPGMHRKVDAKLLAKTAKRLQRCADVVRDMPCDPRKN
jgi:enoyl-CoA hydratase/carnithine racemase